MPESTVNEKVPSCAEVVVNSAPVQVPAFTSIHIVAPCTGPAATYVPS